VGLSAGLASGGFLGLGVVDGRGRGAVIWTEYGEPSLRLREAAPVRPRPGQRPGKCLGSKTNHGFPRA
jgi:hypothetical protein